MIPDNLALTPYGALFDRGSEVAQGLVPYQPGCYVMTDDRAPVELLGMQVIDELIREEAAYYRRIYEKEGIQGLLKQL